MKKTLSIIIGSLLALTALNSCKPEEKVFTIAYAPNESTTESADARYGLAQDLEKALGMKVKEIQASDYNAIIEGLRTGQIDIAYAGPQAVALGMKRAKCTPIVMKAPEGKKELAFYKSVIITSADNAHINSIKDIKGKSMAFVDPSSTSGSLIPSSDIIAAFPQDQLNLDKLRTNGEFFSAVSFSGKHQAGLMAVRKKDADLAPISNQILASEIAHGRASESEIKVIHESAPIPAEAIVAGKHLDDEMKAKLVNFLTSYDNETYFTEVIKKPKARFVECGTETYQPIIELNENLNN